MATSAMNQRMYTTQLHGRHRHVHYPVSCESKTLQDAMPGVGVSAALRKVAFAGHAQLQAQVLQEHGRYG